MGSIDRYLHPAVRVGGMEFGALFSGYVSMRNECISCLSWSFDTINAIYEIVRIMYPDISMFEQRNIQIDLVD